MDMDMDHGSSGPMCKMSMLWNWETIDTCFLSSTWHVHSNGGFAGSVIGVFFLTFAIEFVRFYGRSYDRELIKLAQRRLQSTTSFSPVSTLAAGDNEKTSENANLDHSQGPLAKSPEVDGSKNVVDQSGNGISRPIEIYPTWTQQIIRGLCYGSQFTASFIVMLFGMYFNGYILIAIFLGQTTGYLLFGKDLASGDKDGTGSGHCC